MKCVYCKENEATKEKGVYPFCSSRRKALDLGAWAKEDYRIEGNNSVTVDLDPDDCPEDITSEQ